MREEEWPGTTWKQTSASLTFAIADNFPDQLIMSAAVDGQKVNLLRTSASVSDASATTTTEKSAWKTESTKKSASTTSTATGTKAGTSASASIESRDYLLATGELCEGTHDVSVSAQDAAGHVSIWHRTFLVETTETFGARPMGEGATGKDVIELQKVLTTKGLYSGKANGVYDSATAQAVADFNKSRNLSGGTSIGGEGLALLLGSIRVDLSERKLYLYSEGKLVKTYSVAVGQPAWGWTRCRQGPATRWEPVGWGSPRRRLASMAPTPMGVSEPPPPMVASACMSTKLRTFSTVSTSGRR